MMYVYMNSVRENKYIFKRSLYKSLQITNTGKYHSACRVDTQSCWVCDQVRDNPVCTATETTCGIEILPEVGLSVTISSENTLVLTSSQSDLCLCCSLAAGTFYTNGTEIKFLAAISLTLNFLKDIVLKIDGRISFFTNHNIF